MRNIETNLLLLAICYGIAALAMNPAVAFSADLPPVRVWTGAYGGLEAGYISGRSHFVFTEELGSGASPGNFAPNIGLVSGGGFKQDSTGS
jgi:hypothetical protein